MIRMHTLPAMSHAFAVGGKIAPHAPALEKPAEIPWMYLGRIAVEARKLVRHEVSVEVGGHNGVSTLKGE